VFKESHDASAAGRAAITSGRNQAKQSNGQFAWSVDICKERMEQYIEIVISCRVIGFLARDCGMQVWNKGDYVSTRQIEAETGGYQVQQWNCCIWNQA
jgi:hypothetical protein